MRYARALGWGSLAAAPVMLTSLAVAASSPWAPASIVSGAMWAAWIAGALAFSAALLGERGARTAARITGALSASIAAGFIALVVWSSQAAGPVPLGGAAAGALGAEDGRLAHPTLGFSISDPTARGLTRSPSLEEETRAAGDARWRDAHRVWAWEGEGTQLTLDLAHDTGADVTREIAARLERAGHRVDSVTPDAVSASLAGDGWLRSRVSRFAHDGVRYRLVLSAIGETPRDDLDDLLSVETSDALEE